MSTQFTASTTPQRILSVNGFRTDLVVQNTAAAGGSNLFVQFLGRGGSGTSGNGLLVIPGGNLELHITPSGTTAPSRFITGEVWVSTSTASATGVVIEGATAAP